MIKRTAYLFILLTSLSLYAQAQVALTKSHDSTLPVEITADSLEVLQAEDKAIFSGTVQAKQGDLDIRSSRMTVFYKKSGQKNESQGRVSKVEIDENVFISTPNEVAKGDKGIYDVDDGIISLEGNVTLTSGKNIVKGSKLVYNLKTGQSKMVNTGSTNSAKPDKKERVTGVFVPSGKK